MCCVLSWLQSLFLGLGIKTGPASPEQLQWVQPQERQGLSKERIPGEPCPAPLCPCNSEDPPRPFPGSQPGMGSLQQDGAAGTVHRAQPIIHGTLGVGRSSQCHFWEGKTPSHRVPTASVSALLGLWQHLCANSLPCPPRWLKTT